jgi:DNA-binding phage protein|tara:strand:- start:433 stop:630 length:198 start_codon:yes stop_codon:yes gene_type:complete
MWPSANERMLTLDSIQEILKGDRNLAAVSKKTGISRWTIYRLRDGVGDAQYETVKTLSDYFDSPN